MLTGSLLERAAHANLVEAFASLPSHQADGFVRRAHGVVVAVTGSPVALFNEVLPVDGQVEAGALRAAIEVVRNAGLGAFVQVRDGIDDALVPVLADLGLDEVPEASWPAMVLTELPTVLDCPADLDVHRVADTAGLDDYRRAAGGDPERSATWLGRGLVDDPRWALFVGYVDGEPVTKAMGFQHDGVVGVYDVGTRPSARRRGYGWAMTCSVLVAGGEADCTVATLQSSAMARAMYEAHGFRAVFQYRAFRIPSVAGATSAG